MFIDTITLYVRVILISNARKSNMKKWIFLLIFLCCICVAGIFFEKSLFKEKTTIPIVEKKQQNTSIPTPIIKTKTKTLFVPYWTLNSFHENNYDTFVYFGVAPNQQGIFTSDDGYSKLHSFISLINPGKSLLAIRMTDSSIDNSILNNQISQQQTIVNAITLAKSYNFSGILLDFEISGIGFESQTKKISSFISDFSKSVHQNNLQFATAIYSDAFYRARPYDVKTISSVSDRLFIMAYDFHKAGGDPGPNFPFAESNADSYTFSQMINDFSQTADKKKLTIVFGMFGYDWPVTARGDSVDTATPLTDEEIKKSFVEKCLYNSCVLTRNASDEPSISYRDFSNEHHIIWFEDLQSAQKKIDFLYTKGIGSIAFWANSYF